MGEGLAGKTPRNEITVAFVKVCIAVLYKFSDVSLKDREVVKHTILLSLL